MRAERGGFTVALIFSASRWEKIAVVLNAIKWRKNKRWEYISERETMVKLFFFIGLDAAGIFFRRI